MAEVHARVAAGGSDRDTSISKAVIGVVRSANLRLERVAAGPMWAQGDVSIRQGGCGPVVAGGNVAIRQGGCGPLVARGDVSIERGGCQSIIAGRGATVGERGFAGLVLAPKVTVESGAKVLCNTPQALAFGAAAGIVAVVVSRLLPRR